MSKKNIKQIIQVMISLGIAIWIFWFLYKDIAFDSLLKQIKESNWAWIILSLSISLLGYLIRSWRWTLLIHAEEGKKVTTVRAYHALMVGYLVNMLLPRAGEVARCGVLTRTNGISFGYLFGTVILERIVDLVFLVATIFLAFVIERELFLNLASQLIDINKIGEALVSHLPIILGLTFICGLALWLILKRFKAYGIVNKFRNFMIEIASGLKRVGQLSNPIGFWVSSIALWTIYFLTMYTISLGIPSTANLSSGEILLVMVMGSIGMVAPVQGGIGTFHALVAFILIQLGIAEVDGKIFAAIIHGTQVILVLVAGLISWFVVLKMPTLNKPESL